MKKLTINPFKKTIIIKGFDFIDDCEMSLTDFKQLCFEKGWEGTLHRVVHAESQIIPMFKAAIAKYEELRGSHK